MEISELTLKLILLLIPGAVASIIYEKLTIQKKWPAFKFLAHSILFGALSYLLTQLIPGWGSGLESFWKNLPTKEIPFEAISKAIVTSLAIGFASSGINHWKLVNRFGKMLALTNKYGDENLYSYFLNARNVFEVYVRDIGNNLTYHGQVNSFSETDHIKEIVLENVVVYEYETSAELYTVNKIYLSRPSDSITIELVFSPLNFEANG